MSRLISPARERGISMANGEDKGEVQPEPEKGEKEEKKETVCKVDFKFNDKNKKRPEAVEIFLSLKTPGDARNAIYVLERLKFDFLEMIRSNEISQQMLTKHNRDVLQAKDPMGTNAKNNPEFFKKHFTH